MTSDIDNFIDSIETRKLVKQFNKLYPPEYSKRLDSDQYDRIGARKFILSLVTICSALHNAVHLPNSRYEKLYDKCLSRLSRSYYDLAPDNWYAWRDTCLSKIFYDLHKVSKLVPDIKPILDKIRN